MTKAARRPSRGARVVPGGRWGAALLLAAACVPPQPPEVPPSPRFAPTPGLTVALAWSAPVDLDLYLTDPAAETTYFANRRSRAGARLVEDFRCDDVSSGTAPLEEVVAAAPAVGHWRIGVDFIDACGSRHERVPYRVVVVRDGFRHETVGEVRLATFEAVVLELDVDADEIRVLPTERKGAP